MFVRVGRQARFRVRRACRARQGAADASRRTRRSLKTARDADAADRRRRFDMPSRISWSRASAYITLTLHKLPVAPFAQFLAACPFTSHGGYGKIIEITWGTR